MQGALKGSDPVPMELKNEWNIGPARQAGSPALGSYQPEPTVPWWQRTFPGFSSGGDSPSQGQDFGQGQ
jgi:hypothetical protein